METNIQSAEGSADAEPDSTDIEALRQARVEAFAADLGKAGASLYLPVPRALLEYDQSQTAA